MNQMKPKRFPKALAAQRHLKKVDPKLRRIIEAVGPLKITIDPSETLFESLATSVIYQQLHGKAAATIVGRVKTLLKCTNKFPSPEKILSCSDDALLGAGLSRSKLKSIQDLARRATRGELPARKQADTMDDSTLIETLTQIRGVGPWTAQMCLIFTLGRIDILPTGDYGVRKGFGIVYGKRGHPSAKMLERHAKIWRPYRSAAAWYLWRALELPLSVKIKANR